MASATSNVTVASAKPLIEEIASLASPIVALFAIWAVHNLTKGRDREKAVFDLYKTVSDAVAELRPIVIKAWEAPAPDDRKVAVAQAIWRLQQIGGYVERIRRQSTRWALRGILDPRPLDGLPYASPGPDTFYVAAATMRARVSPIWRAAFKWVRHLLLPWRWTVQVRLTKVMADLRNGITVDPFDDPDRQPDATRSAEVELVIGGFLQAMDVALFRWMDKQVSEHRG